MAIIKFLNKDVNVIENNATLRIMWKYLKKPIILVKRDNGCLECTSHSRTYNGYPKITFNNKTYRLNRFLFCLLGVHTFKDIKGFVLCHTCDNRLCVNPTHLEKNTHAYNMKDMVIKDRQAKGSKVGSAKLKETDVKIIKKSNKTNKELALLYDVTVKTISNIKKEVTWRHV